MSGSKFRSDNIPAVQAFGEVMGELFVAVFQKIGHEQIFRSCATCQHWQEGGANHLGEPTGCKKFKQLPPVSVIVAGCDAYEDFYEIPF